MKDGVHLCGDGHIAIHFLGESDGGVGGEHAFSDHTVHAGDDVSEALTFSEFDADGAIAGESAGAGENEVTEARQSRHGVLLCAATHCETRNLSEAAGN